MSYLKNTQLGETGIIIEDNPNDPNETMLVGSEYTLITTDKGDLDAKLTTLNPNFSAMIVDMFLTVGLNEGDKIAVSMTGSMPGANLAILSACEVMNIEPFIITSVGASQWGATDPYFTWLDMESILFNEGYFSHKSFAASIGGGSDIGKGLTLRGRELLWEAIYRNDLPLIQETKLSSSIEKRMELFASQNPLSDYQLFVNVGGGAASVGQRLNVGIIPHGLSQSFHVEEQLSDCVVKRFYEAGLPVMHLLSIEELIKKYQLPFSPIPMPGVGEGELFATVQYNRTVAGISLLFCIIGLCWVGISSHKKIKKLMVSYEPDESL